MEKSKEDSVERTDILELRTFLSSILPEVAFYRLPQEMPFRLWLEWSGPWMSSSAMVVPPSLLIE